MTRRTTIFTSSLLALGLLALTPACDSMPSFGGDNGDGAGGDGGNANRGTDRDFDVPDQDGNGGAGGKSGQPDIEIFETLPDGFVGADGNGGWKVQGLLSDLGAPEDGGCANVLTVLVRDFSASHSDFQNGSAGLVEGIVQDDLGSDQKPVPSDPLPNGSIVDSAASFDDWYHSDDATNTSYLMDMWLEPVDGTFVFDSTAFFPMTGYGDELHTDNNGDEQNFHFTTELHTRFEYAGGETFTFRGDDDVWVFINGVLAIDIGGVHGPEAASVNLDDDAAKLGIETGATYTLDLFQAERQTVQSNFRIETTLDFTECGTVLEEDVIAVK